MDPYSFNFTHCSQASGGGYVQMTTQSVNQDSRALSSLQGPASEYPPTAPQMPVMNPRQSFRPSVGSGSIRTPSSSSSHPYHQARLRQAADRGSAQHQGWSQLSFPTVPAPAPASGMVTPYNAVIGDCASTRCHDSRPLQLVARKSAPAPVFGSASQSNIEAPNTNQIMSSFMASLMVPGQTFLPEYETPASLSYTPADEADIEYAQYHYGNKRCFYQCRFDLSGSPCNKWIVGDRIRVLRHLRTYHRLQMGPAKPAHCRWDKCTHSRPMKQENLSRHVVMHLGVKWKCPHCRRLFSRDDAVHRHIERMVPGMEVPDAEVVPGCEARVINESPYKRARIA